MQCYKFYLGLLNILIASIFCNNHVVSPNILIKLMTKSCFCQQQFNILNNLKVTLKSYLAPTSNFISKYLFSFSVIFHHALKIQSSTNFIHLQICIRMVNTHFFLYFPEKCLNSIHTTTIRTIVQICINQMCTHAATLPIYMLTSISTSQDQRPNKQDQRPNKQDQS